MAEGNGYVKWWQLVTATVSIMGVVVTLFIFSAKEVIAVDLRATQRFMDNRAIVYKLLEANAADHELMKCQLARIETKLEWGENK